MKSFKNLNFGTDEVLQRNQMKSILGGASITHIDESSCGQAVEFIPAGCPCGSLPCEGGRHMQTLEGSGGTGTNSYYSEGKCVNGVCGY